MPTIRRTWPSFTLHIWHLCDRPFIIFGLIFCLLYTICIMFSYCVRRLVLVLAMSPVIASAYDIDGHVVAIADGDTLTVLRGHEQIRIRLTEIDAPEKAQAFGQRSKESLARLCFNKPVKVIERGQDGYGRTLGRVWCGGVDANAEQVRTGMAWVYDRYATDKALYPLQEDAKRSGRGLWADADPTPPWEWRHQVK